MGKYSDFPSQIPKVRAKSAIYTPKGDDELLRHFHMAVPPSPDWTQPETDQLSKPDKPNLITTIKDSLFINTDRCKTFLVQ